MNEASLKDSFIVSKSITEVMRHLNVVREEDCKGEPETVWVSLANKKLIFPAESRVGQRPWVKAEGPCSPGGYGAVFDFIHQSDRLPQNCPKLHKLRKRTRLQRPQVTFITTEA